MKENLNSRKRSAKKQYSVSAVIFLHPIGRSEISRTVHQLQACVAQTRRPIWISRPIIFVYSNICFVRFRRYSFILSFLSFPYYNVIKPSEKEKEGEKYRSRKAIGWCLVQGCGEMSEKDTRRDTCSWICKRFTKRSPATFLTRPDIGDRAT